jgi:hypothetical protein
MLAEAQYGQIRITSCLSRHGGACMCDLVVCLSQKSTVWLPILPLNTPLLPLTHWHEIAHAEWHPHDYTQAGLHGNHCLLICCVPSE